MKVFKSEKKKKQVLDSYDQLLKQWGVDLREVDVQTKYGITHCILAGDEKNPPLVLFHGVGDNSAVMWILNMKELSRHFFCIAVDTIGGPGKSQPNENFNKKIFSQSDWINQVADHFSLKQFHVAGVSNGGVMAYSHAAREPGRVGKVVCLEGGPVTNPFQAILSTMLMAFPELLFPTRKNLLKIMQKMSAPGSTTYVDHPEISDHMILVMRSHKQSAMYVHPVERYDRERAEGIRDRVLLVFGSHMMKKRGEYIKFMIAEGLQYKVIEGAGHGVNHDFPELVHQEMISFLLG